LNHKLDDALIFTLQKGFQKLDDFNVQVNRFHLLEFADFLDHFVLNKVQTNFDWHLRFQDQLGQELHHEAPAEFNALSNRFVLELLVDENNEVLHDFINQNFTQQMAAVGIVRTHTVV
jgi:aminoglycoside/choline kinase family phosphotransferase